MFLPLFLWESFLVDNSCDDTAVVWAHMINLVWLACWTGLVDVPPVREWYLSSVSVVIECV